MPHFFGLGPRDLETVLEQFYYLMRVANISYEAIRRMPVAHRRWFIGRLNREAQMMQKKQETFDDDTPISAVIRNR